MKKTNKLITGLLAATFTLSVSLTGCASRPEPPNIAGYNDEEWVYDEENDQWAYDEDDDGDFDTYWYAGGLHKAIKKGTKFVSKSSGFGKSFSKFGG